MHIFITLRLFYIISTVMSTYKEYIRKIFRRMTHSSYAAAAIRLTFALKVSKDRRACRLLPSAAQCACSAHREVNPQIRPYGLSRSAEQHLARLTRKTRPSAASNYQAGFCSQGIKRPAYTPPAFDGLYSLRIYPSYLCLFLMDCKIGNTRSSVAYIIPVHFLDFLEPFCKKGSKPPEAKSQ